MKITDGSEIAGDLREDTIYLKGVYGTDKSFLDMFKELSKIEDDEKYCSTLPKHKLALPSGEVTYEYTPEVVRIIKEKALFRIGQAKKISKKVMRALKSYKERHGYPAYKTLYEKLGKITMISTIADGHIKSFMGPFIILENRPYLLNLNLTHEEKRMYTLLGYAVEEYMKIAETKHCPSSFAYEPEYMNFSKLGKLLDENKYRVDEDPNAQRKKQIRSVNAEMKSNDDKHKVFVTYYLGKDTGKFCVDVKYVAFGLKTDDSRDKMDVVLTLDENANVSAIKHFEARLPKTFDLYIEHNELNPIDCDMSDLFIKNEGFIGTEFKTDGATNQVCGYLFFKDRTEKEYERYSIGANYKQLLQDPTLLGGYGLGQVVKHVRENMPRLKEIYESKM